MRTTLLAVVLSLGVGLLTAGAAPAQLTPIHGTIEALDREAGSITLLVPPKHESKAYSLSKPDLPITDALGQPLKLAELKKRQRVLLQLDERDDVQSIRVDENCMWAHILKVQSDERKLVVKTGYLETVLAIPEEVPVLFDGKKVGLAELKPNMGIKAIYSAGRQKLLQVQTGRSGTGTNPYCRWATQVGILLKADHERRTIQILTTSERYTVHEYEYQPWTVLRLIHSSYLLRTTDMTALHPYCRVVFYYETDTKNVTLDTVEVPTLVRRKVAAVDRAGRRITLKSEDETQTFEVAADAMIRKPAGLARWEDVTEGSIASCGLSLDGKEVMYLHLWDK